ncbi:MAG: hypothetical protein RBS80_04030 [Thermoguttaceae bacterium]|nr:hypothetical protein [Thermoguttaceae bacterium]
MLPVFAAILLLTPSLAAGEKTAPTVAALFAEAARRDEGRWERHYQPEPPHESVSARGLMSYALTLAEAGMHNDRLPRLMELIERMQDRDPESPDYGNLWWYWRDGAVTDRNSVEFVTQTATRLWVRHGLKLPPDVATPLMRIMTLGAEGCLRHRVPVWYTNIAILNASNLIALGEILDDTAVAEAGYRRLKDICLWTWKFGVTEYVSPTYYAVNLDGLRWIAARAGQAEGRRQAEALLELLATDIGANWWPPAERLAGAHSRSYNYLHGIGGLDERLALAGWLPLQIRPSIHHADAFCDDWSLPAAARELAGRLARRVRQRWGEGHAEVRSAVLLPDITLSTASAYYGSQDVPMAVDLPGGRSTVRCYFIADGRDDPYGTQRYPTGRAGHMKALHLSCFWAAAQRGPDAVGLAVYRAEDLVHPERTGLKSHFVFRREHQGLWIGDRRVDLAPSTAGESGHAGVALGEAVVVRYGTAALGVRVLVAQCRDGSPALVSLVDDTNPHGAMRLSVEHESAPGIAESAAAAFWVRIGSGLADDAAFADWRDAFMAAEPHVHVVPPVFEANGADSAGQFQLRAPGEEGLVAVEVSAGSHGIGRVSLDPPPTDAILEIDGQQVGRPLLADLLPVREYVEGADKAKVLTVPNDGPLLFGAQTGLRFGGMEIGLDDEASGGAYVGSTVDRYQAARFGSVRWSLDVPEAGRYWLWGRVLARDPQTDSFYVQLLGPEGAIVPRTAWHTRTAPSWTWRVFESHPAREPIPLDLPAARVELILRVREPGTKIDHLMLTRDPDARPEQFHAPE